MMVPKDTCQLQDHQSQDPQRPCQTRVNKLHFRTGSSITVRVETAMLLRLDKKRMHTRIKCTWKLMLAKVHAQNRHTTYTA